jgi:glucokinase
VSAAGDLLLDRVRDAYGKNLTGRGHRPLLRIEMAAFGPEAGMIGAADLARDVAGRGGGTTSG